jgi:hypothetical protein
MQVRNLGKLFFAAALMTSAALVFAQGGGGGGGGRGFGQGRGMGGQSPAQMASRADVQRDLAMTDDQKSKVAALSDKMNEERRAMMQEMRGGGDQPDMTAFRAAMEKFNAKSKEELAKILTADQMKRLDEIGVQIQGNRALLVPAVQKALGLSEETIKKANELQTKQNEANMSIFEKVRNQEISQEEMRAAMEKNNKALNDELGKLLTPEQAAKLKEMGGKEFKADPPRGGGN